MVAPHTGGWSDGGMERLSPVRATEPMVKAAGSGGARQVALGALAVMLVAGAWLRFNGQIASSIPALAAPAALLTDPAGARLHGLVELGLLPLASAQAAVAEMGLPAGDAALLTDAIRRRRLRLVRMPLFDAGLGAPDPQARTVEVSAAGFTRIVHLGRQPVVVTLPVGPIASVRFRTFGADAVDVGALTLDGPAVFPGLHAGQMLDVGIVAQ